MTPSWFNPTFGIGDLIAIAGLLWGAVKFRDIVRDLVMEMKTLRSDFDKDHVKVEKHENWLVDLRARLGFPQKNGV